jgi:hypothetical protein
VFATRREAVPRNTFRAAGFFRGLVVVRWSAAVAAAAWRQVVQPHIPKVENANVSGYYMRALFKKTQ